MIQDCRHAQWLVVERQSDSDFQIHMTDRFQRLHDQILNINDHPDCTPGIWLSLGRAHRARWNKAAFGGRCSSPAALDSTLELYLPASRAFTDHPVLLAQGDLIPSQWSTDPSAVCHQKRRVQASTQSDNGVSAMDVVYAEFVAGYAEVICVFCDDYDTPAVLDRLGQWVRRGPGAAWPTQTLPHLVLLASPSTAEADLAPSRVLAHLARVAGDRSWRAMFSALTVVPVLASSGGEAGHSLITSHIQGAARQTRMVRAEVGFQFPASVLPALWRAHLTQLEQSPGECLNLVRALRRGEKATPSRRQHVATFLRAYHSPRELQDEGIALLATILYVDHRDHTLHALPGDHVFDALYFAACNEAFADHCASQRHMRLSAWEWTQQVRKSFHALDEHVTHHPEESRLDILRHQWNRARSRWSKFFSVDTCLSCLGRRPSVLLPCGHRLCRQCVQTFGRHAGAGRDRYHFPDCLLCGAATGVAFLTLRRRCRRILAIDGGGVRGVMPLQFLTLLEARLGVPGLTHHLFDYVIGTSSGGANALALAVKAWSPARCREAFTELARDAFSVRKVTKYLGPSALHRGTLACMLGSLYPAQGLERALRRCFGATTPIDDCRSAAVENGVYVAVTTTTVPGSEPRLLTNYNGIGQRSDGDDHSARCTTAAPWYFPVHTLSCDARAYQDGGTWCNGPIKPGLQEARLLELDLVGGEETTLTWQPSLILSLGTGRPPQSSSGHADAGTAKALLSSLLRRCLLGRSWDFLNFHTSGHQFWADFAADHPSLVHEGRAFRVDPVIPSEMIGLDEVAFIPRLVDCATDCSDHWQSWDVFPDAVVASMFQLDLLAMPRFKGGKVVVSAQIASTWEAPVHGDDEEARANYEAWSRCVTNRQLQIFVQGVYSGSPHLDAHGNWTCAVEFDLAASSDPISVGIRTGRHAPLPINGSPYRLDGLLDLQGIEVDFFSTREDHQYFQPMPPESKKRSMSSDGQIAPCPPRKRHRKRLMLEATEAAFNSAHGGQTRP